MPESRSITAEHVALSWLCALLLASCQPDVPAPKANTGPPRRIISLAPSLTELLFALGVGDRVVAVSQFCDQPGAEELPRVGDAKQVSLEPVVVLRPDLILVNSRVLEELLRPIRHRYEVLRVPTECLAEVLTSVDRVGVAVHAPQRAAKLRRQLEGELSAARARPKDKARGRVLVVLQRSPFVVAGAGSYVDELLAVLGHPNAAAKLDSRWPTVSAEALLVLAPDVILEVSMPGEGAAGLDYWQRFPTLPAVVNGRVHRLEQDVVVRPGPGLGKALRVLRGVLDVPPTDDPR